ncbi:universal stress protein [Salinigranum sp. GCM10025319]|uniref:universal stress protein n=1 Tax=Salinigranum sp. GCM10025319 TaxID=3252687 RepID=UPI00360D73CC
MNDTRDGGSKYRLLVPIDTNERDALAQARYAGSLPHASESVLVTLTHVLHGRELDTPRELRSAQRVGAVQTAREWLTEHDIESEIRDVEFPYPPRDGILALADKIDADAIVLSGRKRSAIDSVLFGSVVQTIVENTVRPVVVVDPDSVSDGV